MRESVIFNAGIVGTMPRSALILAGGKGKRFGYKEKALIEIEGTPVISRIINTLEPLVDEIIISLRDKHQYNLLARLTGELPTAFDEYEGVGPLAGILAGLKTASYEYIFVTACDMPFPDPKIVELLFSRSQGHDCALIKRKNGSYEPLCAVYRTCLLIPLIEKSMRDNRYFILSPVFEMNDMVEVDIAEIEKIDPSLACLQNINTLDDLRAVRNDFTGS
ncbi:molybdenum cofactor guanylyltransferase [Methanohalophilus mahii]|uniref:Probable molybdenum cofactor guanylyltransferase n=1 Tax=Methanohalophilus mahii (strain ATCC 35705 / DSM 5219 / SLP) TaxID=547558 RepID=D5EBZ9_METMS|nr:molybdenum cofactor guanylyltransferase [Methanohalophilus mahii]ADE36700.1 formate dehydrogenase family accessory protein FdhD [Methanohalophilus mahii DSM 5219]